MTDVRARAEQCQRLLDDPNLQQAFQSVRDALHQAFAKCPTNDADTMVDIRKRLHLLDSVEQNLRIAIQDGRLEQFRMDEDEKPPFLGDLTKWKRRKKS